MNPAAAWGQQRILKTGLRLGCVVLVLWAALGKPAEGLLQRLLPAQALAYRQLMPDHEVLSFGLQARNAQLSIAVQSRSTRYIVVKARAYPAGIVFEASTPARLALLHAALILGGAAWVLRGSRGALIRGAVVAGVAALAMAVLVPSMILAGAQWSLAYGEFEELTLPAILVGLSDFLLHGGAYALCAAVLWLQSKK